MRLDRVVAVALVATLSVRAQSQQQARVTEVPAGAQFIVKTVPLHRLSSAEAVKLLSPYVQTPGGGVYDVSPSVRAVTIRETAKTFAEMMVVLGQYDRDPATVTLTFQLISAENGTVRDPAVAGLDSLLRGVLKFSGYRLLSSSIANASDRGIVSQTLAGDGETLTLSVVVSDLRVEGSEASVHLNVDLSHGMSPINATGGRVLTPHIIGTGVTVPIGQTVVLGTASSDGGQKALILTVRPQLVPTKK
jgi:hypothetical protein